MGSQTRALVHHVHVQSLGGDLTCIPWNSVADPFMYATGSHDVAVCIWTVVSVLLLDRRGRSGNVSHFNDTSSQLHLNLEPHTEYSTGQQWFELHIKLPPISRSSEDAASTSL